MIGIDGTQNGWITANYTDDSWSIDFHEKLSDIEAEKALIDMPVGLPKNSLRDCDQKAREFLVPERHYSIFNCPVRDAVYAESYEEACDINEEKTGKRISKQSWNIVPKIKEVNEYSGRTDLKESHPEVLFKCLREESVKHSKKSSQGLENRIKVLEELTEVPEIREIADDLGCGKDDIVDAMILCVAGRFNPEPLEDSSEPSIYYIPAENVKLDD